LKAIWFQQRLLADGRSEEAAEKLFGTVILVALKGSGFSRAAGWANAILGLSP
jgi:hypothetical protein